MPLNVGRDTAEVTTEVVEDAVVVAVDRLDRRMAVWASPERVILPDRKEKREQSLREDPDVGDFTEAVTEVPVRRERVRLLEREKVMEWMVSPEKIGHIEAEVVVAAAVASEEEGVVMAIGDIGHVPSSPRVRKVKNLSTMKERMEILHLKEGVDTEEEVTVGDPEEVGDVVVEAEELDLSQKATSKLETTRSMIIQLRIIARQQFSLQPVNNLILSKSECDAIIIVLCSVQRLLCTNYFFDSSPL